ncbi:NADPH-dependent FMN reductase, partial [Staphylococcus aureus]|uniref:NADPH-dependent FMN reductase n=1 Tax=Staphylococcus aureus TaxID=1280 RepID=UPI000A84F7B4
IPGALKNVFDLLPVNAFRDKVIGLVATAGSSKHYLIPEMHLNPILSYMKAHTMQTYVVIEERDFSKQQIVNDDVVFRVKALGQSTRRTAEVQQQVLEEEKNQYDF